MSASPDDPDGFLKFARGIDPSISGADFVPRRLYGDYLEHFLIEAERAAPPGVVLERTVDEVTAVEPATDGHSARVTGALGLDVVADRVVLALGNYPPQDPGVADDRFYQSARYIRDPWARRAMDAVDRSKPVLLIGTGLTMLDIALELESRGVSVPLHAVSRHGLLPQPHRPSAGPPAPHHRPPGIQTGPATARAYLRAVRYQVKRLDAEGVDWRNVIDSLRALTPGLWHELGLGQRSRFLRHVRPYWEVHRHRAAPAAYTAFRQLIDGRKLRVRAARVTAYKDLGDAVRVSICPRGARNLEQLDVGTVINCTGPSADVRTLRDPLIDFLRSRGMVRPDSLGLGLETAENGALLDAAGLPSPVIYYVGPLLKASHWESTAVPELRVHAARLAATLAESLAVPSPLKRE
jgi:uncharacterized NAD(P)/FAD-binding protein YdhS